MDTLRRLPRTLQVVLGGTLLYVIFSFLDWQQVSIAGFTAGIDEWHGVGVVAGLLAFAVLVWETARVLGVRIEQGAVDNGLVSLGLCLLLALFTLITFLSHDVARHWPAWIGLVLSLAVGAAAVVRAREEGVRVPDLGSLGGGAVQRPRPPAPTSDAEPPPPAAGSPDVGS